MQTSRIEQTSTRQVINRLKAFSSGPPGLGPAFTVAMVQQAIDECLALQGSCRTGISICSGTCMCLMTFACFSSHAHWAASLIGKRAWSARGRLTWHVSETYWHDLKVAAARCTMQQRWKPDMPVASICCVQR